MKKYCKLKNIEIIPRSKQTIVRGNHNANSGICFVFCLKKLTKYMNKKNILVITNNELIKWAILKALKKSNFEFDHCIDCDDAKLMIKIKQYDYIIIDTEKELNQCIIKDIKKLQPNSLFIILTNSSTHFQDENIKYLIKPFKIDAIKYIIASH